MNVESMIRAVSAGLGAALVWVTLFAISMRAAAVLRRSLGRHAIASALLAPVMAAVNLLALRRGPPASWVQRGGSVLGAGPDGVWSVKATLAGVAPLLTGLAATVWVAGGPLGIEGEHMHGPIGGALIVFGMLGGLVMARVARRVAFVEALAVTGLTAFAAAALAPLLKNYFTYGTAAAYFVLILFAASLVALIALTVGGSIGYLLTGDGAMQPSWSYEKWIGRRFLMGKRSSGAVSIITLLSVFAVVVATSGMVVVMSVMNGFSSDLRSKIMGANAHLIVLKYGTDFSEYEDIVKKTKTIKQVTGASPFVLNEVMISSDINLSGALLKGVDVASVDGVSDLRKNMQQGSLEALDPNYVDPAEATPADLKEIAPKNKAASTLHDVLSPVAPSMTPPVGKGSAQAAAAKADALDDALAAALAGTPGAKQAKKKLPGIVIGKEMARNLKVFVGDTVNVVSPVGELGPTGPIPKARAFRVAGVFYSGMFEYDSKFVYIALGEAQDFFTLKGGVTGIEYKVSDVDATPAIARQMMSKIGGYPYSTKDWMEMNRNLFSALKLEKIAMFVILALSMYMASFLILVTLIMVVIEKGKEIAILKSMGATDTSIMKIFITYGVVIGGAGGGFGLLMGLAVCFLIQTYGIGLDPEVYYITHLPVKVDLAEVSVVALAAVLVSYLSTIPPALFAARLRPVEGLRLE